MIISNNPTSNRRMQIWLVLCRYSDPSKAHRHAPQTLICSMDIPSRFDLPHLSIAISGENIAVTVEDRFARETAHCQSQNYLYVFNWKAGFNKTVSRSHKKPLIPETHLELVDIPFQELLHESSFSARRYPSCPLSITILPSSILYSSIHDAFLIRSPHYLARSARPCASQSRSDL